MTINSISIIYIRIILCILLYIFKCIHVYVRCYKLVLYNKRKILAKLTYTFFKKQIYTHKEVRSGFNKNLNALRKSIGPSLNCTNQYYSISTDFLVTAF